MLRSSKIPLSGDSGVVDTSGNPVPPTRTVDQEIARLRHIGAHEAADRLVSGTDDLPQDFGIYPEQDPTTGKKFVAPKKA